MLHIFVLFSLLQAVMTSSQQKFKRSEEYRECFPNNLTGPIENARSLQECGAKCLRTNACMAVIYNLGAETCYLSDRFLQDECHLSPNFVQYQATSGTRNGYDCDIFPESCIKLLSFLEEWHAANDACQAEGARLLVIDDDMKQNVIVQYMTNYNIQNLWLGMSDEIKEGLWRYADGKFVQYKRFSPDQPDNEDGDQHFGSIRATFYYNWDDERNSKAFNVMCEMVRK